MDYDFIINGRVILMIESWFSLFSYLSVFVNFRLHGIAAKNYCIADYANRRKIKASPNRTENGRDADQRRQLWGENEVCLLLIDEQSTTHPSHGLHTIPKLLGSAHVSSLVFSRFASARFSRLPFLRTLCFWLSFLASIRYLLQHLVFRPQ